LPECSKRRPAHDSALVLSPEQRLPLVRSITSPHFSVPKAKDRFDRPTRRVHELRQTDLTYFRVTGWGWYYLLSILDDYSRYVVAWKLYTTMAAEDVQDLLETAIQRTGATPVQVRHRPRLLQLAQLPPLATSIGTCPTARVRAVASRPLSGPRRAARQGCKRTPLSSRN